MITWILASVLLTCWPLGPGLPLVLRVLRVGATSHLALIRLYGLVSFHLVTGDR